MKRVLTWLGGTPGGAAAFRFAWYALAVFAYYSITLALNDLRAVQVDHARAHRDLAEMVLVATEVTAQVGLACLDRTRPWTPPGVAPVWMEGGR